MDKPSDSHHTYAISNFKMAMDGVYADLINSGDCGDIETQLLNLYRSKIPTM